MYTFDNTNTKAVIICGIAVASQQQGTLGCFTLECGQFSFTNHGALSSSSSLFLLDRQDNALAETTFLTSSFHLSSSCIFSAASVFALNCLRICTPLNIKITIPSRRILHSSRQQANHLVYATWVLIVVTREVWKINLTYRQSGTLQEVGWSQTEEWSLRSCHILLQWEQPPGIRFLQVAKWRSRSCKLLQME